MKNKPILLSAGIMLSAIGSAANLIPSSTTYGGLFAVAIVTSVLGLLCFAKLFRGGTRWCIASSLFSALPLWTLIGVALRIQSGAIL